MTSTRCGHQMTLKSSSARDEGRWTCTRKRLNSPRGGEQLLLSTPQPKFPTDWSRDGRFLLYNTVGPKGNVDIWAMPLDGTRTPVEILGTAFNEQHAQFSPDGQWIAYQSDKTGRSEIYVRPFAGSGAEVTVSTSGGSQVRWSPKGAELFYIAADDRLMTVSIRATRTDSPIELGPRRPCFRPMSAPQHRTPTGSSTWCRPTVSRS